MDIAKLAASSLLCAGLAVAQFDPAVLDKLGEAERERTRSPGLALAAVQDGKLVYAKLSISTPDCAASPLSSCSATPRGSRI